MLYLLLPQNRLKNEGLQSQRSLKATGEMMRLVKEAHIKVDHSSYLFQSCPCIAWKAYCRPWFLRVSEEVLDQGVVVVQLRPRLVNKV